MRICLVKQVSLLTNWSAHALSHRQGKVTHRFISPDKLAPEPVASPQHLHLLQWHSLGLRQEEDDVQGHQASPEGEEDVCAPLHPENYQAHVR